jgi:hypothetical protein
MMPGARMERFTISPDANDGNDVFRSKALWKRNIQEFAGGARGILFHVAMARHRSDFAVRRIFPNSVVGALPRQKAAMVAKMTFEVSELQAATNWMASRTAS